VQERVAERVVEEVSIDKEWVINKLIENAERAMQPRAVRSEEGEEIGEFTYRGSVGEPGPRADRQGIGHVY
jgi:hypothetical protein